MKARALVGEVPCDKRPDQSGRTPVRTNREPEMNLGATELIIILVIAMLLFGSTRLPKLARSLGQAQKEFKQGIAEGSTDDDAEKK
jgi:sec-independent protein translocase protein TatA